MTQEDKTKFIEINRQIAEWILDAPKNRSEKFRVEMKIISDRQSNQFIAIDFWSFGRKTKSDYIGCRRIEITSWPKWTRPDEIPEMMNAIKQHIKKGTRLPIDF